MPYYGTRGRGGCAYARPDTPGLKDPVRPGLPHSMDNKAQ